MAYFLTLAFIFSVILAIGFTFRKREPGESFGMSELLVWLIPVVIIAIYNFIDSLNWAGFE
jgi:hypothetical protein